MDTLERPNWREQIELENQVLAEGDRGRLFESFGKFEGIPKGTKLSEIYSKVDSI